MRREEPVRVTQSLEGCDLLPLDGDDPPQNHVQKKGGDAQEHHGNDNAGALQPLEFVVDRPVGQLQRPRNRAPASVGSQEVVEGIDHGVRLRARHQRQSHIVEPTLHVERRSQGPPLHPEHTEPLVVRHQVARPDGVDVFRREADADDLQVASAAVEDRPYRRAGAKQVRLGEALADDDLVGPARLDVASGAEGNVVEDLALRVRD